MKRRCIKIISGVAGEGRRVVGNIIINTLVTGVVPQEMGIPNSALNHQIPETP